MVVRAKFETFPAKAGRSPRVNLVFSRSLTARYRVTVRGNYQYDLSIEGSLLNSEVKLGTVAVSSAHTECYVLNEDHRIFENGDPSNATFPGEGLRPWGEPSKAPTGISL